MTVAETVWFGWDEENRKLYNGMSMGGAGLGSLMFIYGLSLQRKEQG